MIKNIDKSIVTKNRFFANYVGSALLLSIILVGCQSNSFVIDPIDNSSNSSGNEDSFLINELPISAKTVINGEQIDLEVALTPEAQGLGLMYRDYLPPNRGMLFPFEFPRRASFWMKNVTIPLDMIFLYQGEVKFIEENVPPCEIDPCPIYGDDQIVDQVLELAGGRVAQLNISKGDRIEIEFFDSQGEK